MKKSILLFLVILINLQIYCFEENGTASWYGPSFHGKITANGEVFDTNTYTAAHRTLPFGSIVKVISEENNKETIVRITDRGPFAKDRIIDLSKSAALDIGMLKKGTMNVRIILLEKGDNKYYRGNSKLYKIQFGSFSDEEKALSLVEKLKSDIQEISIKKIFIEKPYYRVVAENLSYKNMQSYRVILHKEKINNYLIVKK